jgi:hypothetical protein
MRVLGSVAGVGCTCKRSSGNGSRRSRPNAALVISAQSAIGCQPGHLSFISGRSVSRR